MGFVTESRVCGEKRGLKSALSRSRCFDSLFPMSELICMYKVGPTNQFLSRVVTPLMGVIYTYIYIYILYIYYIYYITPVTNLYGH